MAVLCGSSPLNASQGRWTRLFWLHMCWGLAKLLSTEMGQVVPIGTGAEEGDNWSVDCWGVSFSDSVTLGGSSVKPREKLSDSDVEQDAFWTGLRLLWKNCELSYVGGGLEEHPAEAVLAVWQPTLKLWLAEVDVGASTIRDDMKKFGSD